MPGLVSSGLPLVSVVTPCLNSGQFLRETIESVLAQDYPRLEYIIMDGGSTDGTLAILQEYESRIQFWSEPDGGTADAVNRGFMRARGSLFAFLNADDTYLPGAVSTAVDKLLRHPGAAAVYGDAYWVDREGRTLGPYPTQPFDRELFRQECFVCQPASFIRRSAFEAAGTLDPTLQYAFDYDLWIRLARLYPMQKIDEFLATSRMHKDNKTVGQRRQVLAETVRLLRGHYGYVPFRWIEAYACNLIDGRDQFFEPMQPSLMKYMLSLFLGLRYNTGHALRFIREWASVMTMGGLMRRFPAFFELC